MPDCNCWDYRHCQDPAQERDLKAEGWERAGESGMYQSVILRRKTTHCGRCSRQTREVLDDLGRYAETCREMGK